MRQKIEQLGRLARQLEPYGTQRASVTEQIRQYAEEFLCSLPESQTYVPGGGGSGLVDSPIGEQPAAISDLLELLRREVDTPGINPASGGHLGYIPGGGLYPSALGDYLADVTNRYSGVFFASPGAVRMEKLLVDWMAELVGYTAGSGGDLTSGGSIANLTGIVTAREAHQLKAADIPKTCVYQTAQVHHCVDKALRVAGLKECIRRTVPMDERFRMDADALERTVVSDRKQGLEPWLIVASAGTTDTGSVDPVPAIAEIAERHGLWLHLDAAYGGFFLLCEEGREVLGGLHAADSIVMDPHKGLFLPYGSGALLVKSERLLAEAHVYHADYMQDAVQQAGVLSPAELSPELSRPFRGMRLWLPLKLFGLEPFRAALSEKILLARYFHDELSQAPGFELGPYPELSVVTYRYVPSSGDADEFNKKLVEAVHQDGKVFISSTSIDGKFTLRLAVLNFRTHLDTIDYTLKLLQEKVRELTDG